MYPVYRYTVCIVYYNHLLYIQPKCFGNTVEHYGHANKASFEFEFKFKFEFEFERVSE